MPTDDRSRNDGLIRAFTLTRLLRSLLFGLSATNPLTFTAVAAVFTTVALLACYMPARRAMKVEAMVACVSNNAIAGPHTNWRGWLSSAEPPPCGISQLAAMPAPLEDAMMIIALARQESERVARSRV